MTVIMDAVATATADVPRHQPLNGVTDRTYPYGAFSASLGRGDAYTLDISHGVRHGRVTVQTFGRTAASALSLMEQAISALLDRRLVIDDHECSPLQLELDPSIVRDSDDNGVVGVTATLTFTATKE